MTTSNPPLSSALAAVLDRLNTRHGFGLLDAATLDAYLGTPGPALLLLTVEPARNAETLDLGVVLPEALKADGAANWRRAVLPPAESEALGSRYGVRRYPAVLALRDGAYLGAIEGMRDWQDLLAELAALAQAQPSRPPGVGIAIKTRS